MATLKGITVRTLLKLGCSLHTCSRIVPWGATSGFHGNHGIKPGLQWTCNKVCTTNCYSDDQFLAICFCGNSFISRLPWNHCSTPRVLFSNEHPNFNSEEKGCFNKALVTSVHLSVSPLWQSKNVHTSAA